MNYTELTWRVGTKVRRTLYAVIPQTDPNSHPLIGLMDTPELALEVVNSHNDSLEKLAGRNQGYAAYSFAEKQQLINDMQNTLKLWKESQNLEQSILLVTNGRARSQRVYQAIGVSADILGQEVGVPRIIEHAIEMVMNT